MKKLPLKTKILKILRRIPRYVIWFLLILLVSVTLALIYNKIRSANASSNFEFVRSIPIHPLQESTFNGPKGITRDSANNMYVVDSNNARIEKFDSNGNFIMQFGGRQNAVGALHNPGDIAVDSNGDVYVTNYLNSPDTFEWNIVKYNSQGGFVTSWLAPAATGSQGQGTNRIAVKSDGTLYVIHCNNEQILHYSNIGNLLDSFDIPNQHSSYLGEFTGLAIDSANRLYISSYFTSEIMITDMQGADLGIFATSVSSPSDLSIDSDGNVYVVAFGSSGVRKFDSQGTQTASFGQYGNGSVNNGSFNGISAVESISNKIWVSDASDDRLQRFSSNGTFEAVLGNLGDGQLDTVSGIATDGVGNLMVVDSNRVQSFGNSSLAFQAAFGAGGYAVAKDSNNNTFMAGVDGVRKFNSSNQSVTTWTGGGAGSFSFLESIAVDSNDDIYTMEWASKRIRRFDNSGDYTTHWITTHTPSDLYAKDQEGVYALLDSNNIVKYDNNGNILQTIDLQTPDQQSSLPRAFTIDSYGSIYTLNIYTDTISMYSSSGKYFGSWGATGSEDGQFRFHEGTGKLNDITIDDNGNIFIVDNGNNRVQQFTHDYQLEITTETLPNGNVGDSYSQTIETNWNKGEVTLGVVSGSLPQGLSLDAQTGQITGTPTNVGLATFEIQAQDAYHSETKQFTIRVVNQALIPQVVTNPATNIGSTSATLNGVATPTNVTEKGFEYGTTTGYGYVDQDVDQVDYLNFGSQGTGNGQFAEPSAVAVDSAGNIYVADNNDNDRIQKFDSSGNYISQWGNSGAGNGQISCPEGIAIDQYDVVYVAEPCVNLVQKFDSNGNFISQWGGFGTGDGEFNNVYDIDLDANDYVYTVDTFNSRIQKFDSNGDFISQWSTERPGDTQSSLPQGIAVDISGNVYVADTNNNRIQKFDSNGDYITKWGVYGTGDGGLSQPSALTTDSGGNVYVADSANHRIQKFDSNGNYISQWGGFGTGDGELYFPVGVYVDSSDSLYVADTLNHRIQKTATSIDLNATGLICGTTYHYRAYVTSVNGTGYGQNVTFTTEDCPPPIQINTSSLPDGTVEQVYSSVIETQDGSGDRSFVISDGDLPPGLNLDNLTGEISGTPQLAGDFTFTVMVSDDQASASVQLQIHVEPAPPDPNEISIVTESLSSGQVDQSYGNYIYVENYQGDVDFSIISGSVPPGITVTAYSYYASFEGVPTTAGDYTFTIQASDELGSDTQEYTIVVEPEPAPNEPPVNTPMVTITSPNNNGTFAGGGAVVTGTGPANRTIDVYVDDEHVGSTQANNNGNWIYTVSGIKKGNHKLDARWNPPSDIAYVTRFEEPSGFVSVIDTSTDIIIKDYYIGDYTIGTSATISKDKSSIYVTGGSMSDDGAFVSRLMILDINLKTKQTIDMDLIPDGLIPTEMVVDPTGRYGYVLFPDGFGSGSDQRTFIQKIDLLNHATAGEPILVEDSNNGESLFGAIRISGNGSKVYSVNSANVIYVLDTASNDVTQIDLSQFNEDLDRLLITRIETDGNILYASINGRLEDGCLYGDDCDRVSRLLVLDLTDNSVITNSGLPIGTMTAMLVDNNHTFYGYYLQTDNCYMQILCTVSGYIMKFNVETNDASLTSISNDANGGTPLIMGLNSSKTKLYMPYFQDSKMGVWDDANSQLLTGDNYPISFSDSYIFQFGGNNFIGQINSPEDSIMFKVLNDNTGGSGNSGGSTGGGSSGGGGATGVVISPGTPTEAQRQAQREARQKAEALPIKDPDSIGGVLSTTINNTARQSNISPRQIIYGLPWLIIALFTIFTLMTSAQAYTQFKKYNVAKKRQAFHKQLVEEKAVFISLASHYLRTPATVIKGGVELMGKAATGVSASITLASQKLTGAVNEVIEKLENRGKNE